MSHIDLLREDVSRPFDRDRFSMARRPVDTGYQFGELGEADFESCLDMLVKLPGGDLALPSPYTGTVVEDILEACFSIEGDILPGWKETHYVYLTVDQRVLVPGKTHRNAGWHFDGMQGARYKEKLPACHQYVVSSVLPTEYATHAVDAGGLDEMRHNWFVELGAQVDEGRAGNVFIGKAGALMLMSAYQLHRSPIAPPDEETRRTFVRVDMSLKQQDRMGNTLNPNLAAPFEFHERRLPEGLNYAISDSGWSRGRKM